jgi:response regulator RpfG family c-di-GMP phosphodiesterase
MKLEAASASETILIVDDDVRVVELLQITLGGRGYKVLAAFEGDGALQSLRENKPNCVVLDVRLPRKSGFEVLDTIRRDPALRSTPVILISGDAATETRLQGLKLGADDFLTKPFSPRELIIKIRRILDRFQDYNLLVLKTEVLEDEVRRGRDTLLQMRQELNQNLNRMGSMLNQVLELNQVQSIEAILERFVVTTVSSLEFEQLALLIAGPGGDLYPRIWRGVDDRVAKGVWLAADGPIASTCASMGRPMRIDELEAQPEAQEEILRLSAAGLTLIAPALSGSRLCGVLALGERSSSRPMGRFDSKLLEVLGRAIVAALRNAETFDDTQHCFLETTAALIGNLEERYPFVTGHSARVAALSLSLGRALGLSDDQLESLRLGALLHDLGQLEQYAELLGSDALLTSSDRRLQRRRAAEQVTSLLGPNGRSAVGEIVRHHQEYWDGTGVPDGLRGTNIPLGARIVSLANSWDALIHDRPHRPAYGREDAARLLAERSGKQFDPDLVSLLLRATEEALLEAAS